VHGDVKSDCLTGLHILSCACFAALQILAKLASGMHKPSQQTLVPLAAVQGLLQDLPIPKLRQLGGKFGDELMASLSIKTVGEHLTIGRLTTMHVWLAVGKPERRPNTDKARFPKTQVYDEDMTNKIS